MKILSLHIDGFGKLNDLDLSFEDGLNVLYGKMKPENPPSYLYPRNALWN